MEQSVLFEIENNIASIILNRPDRSNAINQDLLKHLYDYMDKIIKDDNIYVAIITGKGKSFCSGIDLAAFENDNLLDPRNDGTDLPDIFAACKKPIIGAINGPAITGGLELALNCDFLIASEKAVFADTHAKMGIHPGWGMTQLLQNAVGRPMAKQISFTGEFLSAEKAFQCGLVNELIPHNELMIRTKQIAESICKCNFAMISVIKQLIDKQNSANLSESFEYERNNCKKYFETFLKK